MRYHAMERQVSYGIKICIFLESFASSKSSFLGEYPSDTGNEI
jgi:hypothetical protein